ncbi:MAG: hypothetical protein Q9160_009268 [Pyrenula sp. 1 TL-2023]
MKIGAADRQTVLSVSCRNVRDESHLVTRQAKKRRHSASFEPSASDSISDTQGESCLNPQELPPSLQQDGDLSSLSLGGDFHRLSLDRLDTGDIVWEYGSLLDYRDLDGKSQVLVPWYPTWESADEYSKEEVDRVRERRELQKLHRRRGRPRLNH